MLKTRTPSPFLRWTSELYWSWRLLLEFVLVLPDTVPSLSRYDPLCVWDRTSLLLYLVFVREATPSLTPWCVFLRPCWEGVLSMTRVSMNIFTLLNCRRHLTPYHGTKLTHFMWVPTQNLDHFFSGMTPSQTRVSSLPILIKCFDPLINRLKKTTRGDDRRKPYLLRVLLLCKSKNSLQNSSLLSFTSPLCVLSSFVDVW